MPTKQIIVIRKDLKMRKGKEIAQGCHASLAFLTRRLDGEGKFLQSLTKVQIDWLNSSYRKITLQVETLEKLLEIQKAAKELDVECHVITDSGLTEFHGVPTITCLALGPDEDEKIDKITKDLKLY